MRWYNLHFEHNSRENIYRKPFGACPTESVVRLRFFCGEDVYEKKVVCVINDDEILMTPAFSIAGGTMYECKIKTPSDSGLLFYYFYITTEDKTYYYGNNRMFLGGLGEMYDGIPEKSFQITVYDASYETPDWMKNAVVYQIFPDRFCRGKETPFHGTERVWGEEPYYTAEQFGGTYLSNDFFGGNFDGIEKKLPYLRELGITAVYLNPVSKAFSNHRYDTGDYETPDETLGTVEDFESLCKTCKEYGIKIILDGVYSHTGADSRYFNKYENYDSIGAYQGESSPFYSWYNFGASRDEYESWWGFDTLPNVNELDRAYTDYILDSPDSVIKKWLCRGASGFRLDVADELPDEFIQKFRKALKKVSPDALLIGEVWEDSSNKVSYGVRRKFLLGNELDSVMNYVFRNAVLSYLTDFDAELFNMRFSSLLENYPPHSLYSAMNLISSHDVPRAMTVLSGAPDFRTLSREEQHDYKISDGNRVLAERRMVLATCLQMTLPGAPMVYYGDEIGLCGYADPFNRQCMDWQKDGGVLFNQTKILSRLRSKNACLRTGYCKFIHSKNNVIAFLRYTKDGKDCFGNDCTDGSILVVINPTNEKRSFTVTLPYAQTFADSLSKDSVSGSSTLSMVLEPLSYRLLTPERKKEICIKTQSI